MRTLFKFDTSHLRGDLFGGITAGVVALPLALAFGVQSGLGPAAGIYGAMALGFFAAWLGGTASQVSGPTGPMTVVSAGLAATIAARYDSLEEALGAILLTFLLAGAIQVLLGILRVGKYIRLVPYPVVSGFMTGIGVIIILLQVFPVFGMASPPAIIDVFLRISEPLASMNWMTIVLAASTLGIILFFSKITKAVPSTLVALIVMTLVPLGLGWDVPRIGKIPLGLPDLHIAGMFHVEAHLWSTIIADAAALSMLGALDSLLTSLVADSMTRTRHDSERELIGQGIGNMVTAAIGGIPGAGATMRTVVNIQSGGRTRISGMVHGLLLLMILLGLGQYAAHIPLAVLAGILISVGMGIMDIRGIKQLRYAPRADAAVLALVLVFTVFFDLIQAVALGLALASLLFMKRMGDESARRTRLGALGEFVTKPTDPDELELHERLQNEVQVKHFYGPLHFGYTSALQDMAATIPQTKYLVLRMREVPFIDQSGLNVVQEIIHDLQLRGTVVLVCELRSQPARLFRESHLAPGLIREEHILELFKEVLPAIARYEQEQHGSSTAGP